MGPIVGDSDDKDRECELQTKRLYNRLRLWAATALGVVLVLLTVLDVLDNYWLGNRYEGPPTWLITMVGGILAALFGSATINNMIRRQ